MPIYTVTDVFYSKGGFKSKYDQILVPVPAQVGLGKLLSF